MGLEFYEQEAGQGLFSTSLLVEVVVFSEQQACS